VPLIQLSPSDAPACPVLVRSAIRRRYLGATGKPVSDTPVDAGESEEIVGEALRGRRDQVVVGTKFGLRDAHHPNRQGASLRWWPA